MIDGAGWGLFFIWVGIVLLADLGWAAFFLGTGALMVGGQLVRHRFELTVDRFTMLLGACFAVAGLVRLLELRWPWAAIPGWVMPMLLIGVGVALLISAWSRGR